jgi:hypothetical protein
MKAVIVNTDYIIHRIKTNKEKSKQVSMFGLACDIYVLPYMRDFVRLYQLQTIDFQNYTFSTTCGTDNTCIVDCKIEDIVAHHFIIQDNDCSTTTIKSCYSKILKANRGIDVIDANDVILKVPNTDKNNDGNPDTINESCELTTITIEEL